MKNSTRLDGVNPRLVQVVDRAAELYGKEFMVIEGVRSDEKCWENWGKGRTVEQCRAAGVPVEYAKPGVAKVTWLRNPLSSKHRKQPNGFGHAVDLGPVPLKWDNLKAFKEIASAMLQASRELNITIRWGGDWDRDGIPHEKGETDSPHFELV